jgi:hypothetical protein
MEVRQRSEFSRAGVYILVGYQEDDFPTIYIGQADGVRNRIQNHYQNKDFWDWGIIIRGRPQAAPQLEALHANYSARHSHGLERSATVLVESSSACSTG